MNNCEKVYSSPVLLFVFVCPAKSTAFPSPYCLFIAPSMRENYKFFVMTLNTFVPSQEISVTGTPLQKELFFYTIRILMVQRIVVPKIMNLIFIFISTKII